MALTISIEGKGVIANSDSVSSDSAGGSWAEDGLGTMTLSTETYLYGSSCVATAYSNKSGWSYYDIGSGNELDFSASGSEEGQLIYMWIFFPTPGLGESQANGGFTIRIGNDASNYRDFMVSASDNLNGWYGDWKCFVIDPTKPGTVSDTGTFNLASVRRFGCYLDATASAKGDNLFIDQIAVGFGLRITGTSTTGWKDVVDYCTDYANRAWGMVQERDGIYYVYGKIYIGDSTQTAVTSFSDSGRVIRFATTQYYYSTGWVTTADIDYGGIIVEDNATYSTTFNDGVAVGTDAGRSGTQFIGDPELNISVDLYGGNNASSITTLYNTTFKALTGGITWGNDSDHKFFSGNVIACTQFDPVGAVQIRNCIFAETADADSALLWNENINIQSCSFIANTVGAAIEHSGSAGSPYTYTNLVFSGNTYDGLNTSGSNITVNLVGTSNAANDEGANTITYSASYTLSIYGLASNTEVTIVKRGTAVDTGTDGSTTANSRNFVTTNSWTTDAYKGHLLEITTGADAGRYYVTGNNATTLYLDAELTATASSIEWDLYDENDDTVEFHLENSSGVVEYTYGTASVGNIVDILAFHVDYQDIVQINYELDNANVPLPLSQVEDVNYFNP